jgi:ubiquinone/menaquinone biosynthesis C-methylase UbiE
MRTGGSDAASMATYLQGHHESVLRSHRWRTAANSCAYLLPHLRPGLRLLDVGCGPGTITSDLARVVAPGGSVLAVDAAEEVVDAARAGSTEPAVDYAVMDAYALELEDASFDVAHAHQVLQHLQDPVAALKEMRRVTRAGGVVAVRDADYAAMTWHPASEGLDRWLELYRALARRQGAEPDAGRRVLGWARAAGFADVAPSASVWCFATAEDRAWWGTMQADRIVASRIAELAEQAGLAGAGELAHLADAWRAWASCDEGWFAVLHGEALCRVA